MCLISGARNIRLHGNGLPTCRSDLLDDSVGLGRVTGIGRTDSKAIMCQPHSDGATDSAPCANLIATALPIPPDDPVTIALLAMPVLIYSILF